MASFRTLVLVAGVSAMGCGALGPPPDPTAGGGPPRIGPAVLACDPPDGTTGVGTGASIVITFDRPMNPRETQAAFQSSSIPAPTFKWNAEFTIMTVTPGAPLPIATGTNTTFPANAVSFEITYVARDARGVSLNPPFSSKFSTLRRGTFTLKSDLDLDGYVRADGQTDTCQQRTSDDQGRRIAACVGHSREGNASYQGLLTFDLGPLPDGIVAFESARLQAFQYRVDGKPYVYLGVVNLEHLMYESKRDAARAGSLRTLGVLSTTDEVGWKEAQSGTQIADAVADDYAERVARKQRSQYRLVFSKPNAPEAEQGHAAKFYTRMVEQATEDPLEPGRQMHAPRLEVTALFP